jgi:hypothetical protein
MIGSVDTTGFICGAAGLLCVSLTQLIYQVPGYVSSTWQGEEDFVQRQVRGLVPCLGARNPAGLIGRRRRRQP